MREPFRSIDDVRAYLDQPVLTCLICNHPYQALVYHITNTHNMTAREYRALFGIPLKFVLAGNLSSQRKNETGATGDKPTDKPAASPQAKTTVKSGKRKRRSGRWLAKDYEEYLDRVAKGRGIQQVGMDKDLMSANLFRKWCREHADFAKRLAVAVDNQPFPTQAKGKYAGNSLNGLIVFLFEAHYINFLEIGATLGVSHRAIGAFYKRLVKTGEIEAFRL